MLTLWSCQSYRHMHDRLGGTANCSRHGGLTSHCPLTGGRVRRLQEVLRCAGVVGRRRLRLRGPALRLPPRCTPCKPPLLYRPHAHSIRTSSCNEAATSQDPKLSRLLLIVRNESRLCRLRRRAHQGPVAAGGGPPPLPSCPACYPARCGCRQQSAGEFPLPLAC